MLEIYLFRILFSVVVIPLVSLVMLSKYGVRGGIRKGLVAFILLIALLAAFSEYIPPDYVVSNNVWLWSAATLSGCLVVVLVLRKGNYWKTYSVVIYVSMCIFLVLGLASNAVYNGSEDRTFACLSNLRSVSLAVKKYKMEKHETPSLSLLVSNGYLAQKELAECPAGGQYVELVYYSGGKWHVVIMCRNHLRYNRLVIMHDDDVKSYRSVAYYDLRPIKWPINELYWFNKQER